MREDKMRVKSQSKGVGRKPYVNAKECVWKVSTSVCVKPPETLQKEATCERKGKTREERGSEGRARRTREVVREKTNEKDGKAGPEATGREGRDGSGRR